MNLRLFGVVLAALVVQTVGALPHAASASPAAMPLCSARDVAASIIGQDGGAGTMHTSIALVNVSKHACALAPYPKLSFASNGSGTPIHVAVNRIGTAGANVPVVAGASGVFILAWSDVDGTGPCRPVADVYVALPHGIPLWVPVRADACRAMQQSAMIAGPAHALPDARTALNVWYDWSIMVHCDADMGALLKGSSLPTPSRADWLTFNAAKATVFELQRTPPDTNTLDVLFDPGMGMLAELQTFGHSSVEHVVCGPQSSVPYGIAYTSLGALATHRGVRFGMTPAQVVRIEGASSLHQLNGGYATLAYAWAHPPQTRNRSDVLAVLFYKNRVVGILSSGAPGDFPPR